MPHVKAAFDWFEKNVGKIRDDAVGASSLLYVGIRHDTSPWWLKDLCPRLGITRVGVVEIFPKNLSDFEQQFWAGKYGESFSDVELISGDVREIDKLVNVGEYDIIFFDHGPEHLDPEDIDLVTRKLERIAGKLVLYSAPWGHWPQGEEDGNEHEVHRSNLIPDDFRRLGMNVETVNSEGVENGGELIAWMKSNHR
jgi:hypothetical protein